MQVGDESFRDDRVVAAIPISMSEPFGVSAYRRVVIPLMNITGTRDMSIVYGTLPRHRRVPFEGVPGGGTTTW